MKCLGRSVYLKIEPDDRGDELSEQDLVLDRLNTWDYFLYF